MKPTTTPFSYDKLTITKELTIGNPNGQHLRLEPEGISFWTTHNQSFIDLSVISGTPEVTLYDHNKQERVKLSIAGDGEPEIKLLDANGHTRMVLGIDQQGEPYATLYDAQEERRACFVLTEAGVPELWVYDKKEGEQIWAYTPGTTFHPETESESPCFLPHSHTPSNARPPWPWRRRRPPWSHPFS